MTLQRKMPSQPSARRKKPSKCIGRDGFGPRWPSPTSRGELPSPDRTEGGRPTVTPRGRGTGGSAAPICGAGLDIGGTSVAGAVS